MAKVRNSQLVEELRTAVKRFGNDFVLSQKTGISQSVINRFRNGKIGIGLERAGLLFDALGFEVIRGRTPKEPNLKTRHDLQK